MAFNIKTFGDSVVNLIDKNNTTTSSLDVSSGLTSRIKKITLGWHVNKAHLNINYPAVWVEIGNRSEAFDEIGNSARRKMSIPVIVVGVVQDGLGQTDGREVSDAEMLSLSANLETLIRNKPQLSNTSQVLQAVVSSVEYDVVEDNDTYNSISRMTVDVTVLSV